MLDVRGRLSLDGRAWDTTIRNAQKSAGGLASFVASNVGPKLAAAFTVGAVVTLTQQLAEMAGTVKDSAERLGITTDTFQEFSHAAQRSGADAAFITTAYEKFIDALQKIKSGESGGDKLLLVLERYGITLEEINSQNPEELFRGFADSLSGMAVDGQVTADMIDLLGKSGGKLIPVLRALKDESEDIKGSFNFMSKEEIEAYDKAGDKLTDFWKATKLGAGRVGIGLKQVFDGSVGEMMSGLDVTGMGEENSQKVAIKAMEQELAMRRAEKAAREPKKKTDEEILAEREAKEKADEKTEKERLRLVERTEELREKNRRSALSEEEQINDLMERRQKLEFQIADAKKKNIGGLFLAQSEHDLEETIQDLDKLQDSKKTTKVKAPDILRDSLVSVGNFLGKSGAQTVNTIAQKQLDKLSSIDRHLYAIANRNGGQSSRDLDFTIL